MIENFRGISTFLFIYSTISRGTVVGKHCCGATVNPTQLFARWVLGALSLGIKQPGREANLPPPCIGEVNNASCPPTCSHGMYLHFVFTVPLQDSVILLAT